jgi:hypothetical protein
MFVRTLTQNVDLDAAEFFGDVEQKARDKFIRETEGKCMKDCGEVDAVLEILATEQKPLLSSASKSRVEHVFTALGQVTALWEKSPTKTPLGALWNVGPYLFTCMPTSSTLGSFPRWGTRFKWRSSPFGSNQGSSRQ